MKKSLLLFFVFIFIVNIFGANNLEIRNLTGFGGNGYDLGFSLIAQNLSNCALEIRADDPSTVGDYCIVPPLSDISFSNFTELAAYYPSLTTMFTMPGTPPSYVSLSVADFYLGMFSLNWSYFIAKAEYMGQFEGQWIGFLDFQSCHGLLYSWSGQYTNASVFTINDNSYFLLTNA
jgi:hypothetical protein